MGESAGIGSTIGGYGIQAVLASDRAGVVYRATQTARGRTVALRVIAPQLAESAPFQERFRSEAPRLVHLRQPNVLPMFEAGEADGRPYIASRYLEGQSLQTMIERAKRLTVSQAVQVVSQVAAALDAAHDRGLVHRGVDPRRILVAGEDKSPDIYLTDFVITDDTAAYGGFLNSRDALVPPAADYAAPEQVQGGPVDPRTDVYALGCLLYHALTGRPPFAKGSESDRAKAQVTKDPPSAATVGLEQLGRFDELFARALAKQAGDRHKSAGELARAARAVASEEESGDSEQSERWKRRRVAESWRRMVEAGTMASPIRPSTPARPGPPATAPTPEATPVQSGQNGETSAPARKGAAASPPPGTRETSVKNATSTRPPAAADKVPPAPATKKPAAPPKAGGGGPKAGGGGPPARARGGKEVPPHVDPGAILAAKRVRRRRPVGLLVAVAAVLVGLGLLAGLGTFSDDSEDDRAGTARPSGERNVPRTPAEDPQPPAARDSARDDQSERARDRPERPRRRVARIAEWPSGRSGYTVVAFVSPTDQQEARRRARRAAGIGLRAGVLRSDSHSSLPPGYWVTFAGIFGSQAQATEAANRVRAKGIASSPYTRLVRAPSR